MIETPLRVLTSMLPLKVMAMLRQMTVGSLIPLAMKSTELLRILTQMMTIPLAMKWRKPFFQETMRISVTLMLTLINKMKLILTRRQLEMLTQVLLPNSMRRTNLLLTQMSTLTAMSALTWT